MKKIYPLSLGVVGFIGVFFSFKNQVFVNFSQEWFSTLAGIIAAILLFLFILFFSLKKKKQSD